MSSRNRVVWSDGLFVKPHHFQQQTRWTEALVHGRLRAIEAHCHGFASLTLDADMAHLGKIGIIEASGVFPDGAAFSCPTHDLTPQPLDFSGRGFAANDQIYLCLPLQSENGSELHEGDAVDARINGRYAPREIAARDSSVTAGELADLTVGALRPVIKSGSEDLSAYSALRLCKVLEQRADGSLILSSEDYPTMLSISCSRTLRRFLGDFADGLRRRAEALATRIGSPGQNGVADVSDFLLLQTCNRAEPLFQSFNRREHVHPRDLYEALIQIAGELSTFMSEGRLAPLLPAYDHEAPELCFPPVIHALRQLLAAQLEANATPIQIQRKKYGFMLAPLQDPTIINDRDFVLAVRAQIPAARLQKEFPSHTKIGSIDNIRDLVNRSLSGVPLTLLPVAPRHLPYHAGFSYFQLDQASPHWAALRQSAGFAFHVAGDFPDLEIQFWAIRPTEGRR